MRVLFATRAWESPALEGGLLLLRDLARHFAGSDSVQPYFLSTTRGDDDGVRLVRAYSRTGWGRRQGLQFFFALLRHAGKFDVVHCAHVPTRSNSRLIRFLKYLYPNVHFVQTITAVNKEQFSAAAMAWGDSVVTVGPALHRFLGDDHRIPAELILPVPSPDRLAATRPIPPDVHDRLLRRPVVVFPIDVDRLDSDEFSLREILAELQRSCPDIVFMVLDRFGGEKRVKVQFGDIDPEALIVLPAINFMMSLLRRADVIAYPISNIDGKFNPPMVLLEALGIGAPIVCSDSVDIPASKTVTTVGGFESGDWVSAISGFLTDRPEPGPQMAFFSVGASYEAIYAHRGTSRVTGRAELQSAAELREALQALAEQEQFTVYVRAGHSWQFDTTGARDTDIWLESRHAAKLDALLRSLGAILLIERRGGRTWASQRVYLLPIADGYMQLDVGLDFITAGPMAYAPLAGFDNHPGLMVLPQDVEIFARGAKRLLRGKDLPDSSVNELQQTYRSLDEPGRKRLAAFLGRQPLELDADGPNGSVARKVRVLFRRRIRGALLAAARSPLQLFRVARSKLTLPGWPKPFGRRVRGQVIAIVGTDGTGKSTTLELLQAALSGDGYRTKHVYMGRARGNVLVSDALKTSAGKASERSRSRRLVLKYIASWLYVFDYAVRLARIWYLTRIRGITVLCDRYFYDIETMEWYSRLAYAMLKLVALKPDILMGLDCSIEELMQRKAERSHAEYARQREFYRRVADTARVNFRRASLRTDQVDSNQVVARLSALVHRSAHRRYDYRLK